MDNEQLVENLEIALINLEYAIVDLEYGIERQPDRGDVAKVGQPRPKLASARCAVELGLALLADFGSGAAQIVAN
jgi:hypothetical protein